MAVVAPTWRVRQAEKVVSFMDARARRTERRERVLAGELSELHERVCSMRREVAACLEAVS